MWKCGIELQRPSKSTLMKLDLHVNKNLAVRFDDAQFGCFIADATAMRHFVLLVTTVDKGDVPTHVKERPP